MTLPQVQGYQDIPSDDAKRILRVVILFVGLLMLDASPLLSTGWYEGLAVVGFLSAFVGPWFLKTGKEKAVIFVIVGILGTSVLEIEAWISFVGVAAAVLGIIILLDVCALFWYYNLSEDSFIDNGPHLPEER